MGQTRQKYLLRAVMQLTVRLSEAKCRLSTPDEARELSEVLTSYVFRILVQNQELLAEFPETKQLCVDFFDKTKLELLGLITRKKFRQTLFYKFYYDQK